MAVVAVAVVKDKTFSLFIINIKYTFLHFNKSDKLEVRYKYRKK